LEVACWESEVCVAKVEVEAYDLHHVSLAEHPHMLPIRQVLKIHRSP
jgi:hypothetical protein